MKKIYIIKDEVHILQRGRGLQCFLDGELTFPYIINLKNTLESGWSCYWQVKAWQKKKGGLENGFLIGAFRNKHSYCKASKHFHIWADACLLIFLPHSIKAIPKPKNADIFVMLNVFFIDCCSFPWMPYRWAKHKSTTAHPWSNHNGIEWKWKGSNKDGGE